MVINLYFSFASPSTHHLVGIVLHLLSLHVLNFSSRRYQVGTASELFQVLTSVQWEVPTSAVCLLCTKTQGLTLILKTFSLNRS